MASRKKAVDPEMEAFHRDLLESVRQMRSGQAARRTRVIAPNNHPMADFAPAIALKAKDFANEITNFNARERKMSSEAAMSREHIINNEAVRKTLLDRGIRPESLPAAGAFEPGCRRERAGLLRWGIEGFSGSVSRLLS